MNRWLVLSCGAALIGCANHPVATLPGPDAFDVPAAADAPVVPALALVVAEPAVADTASLHRLVADSAQDQKDMEMLERLHDAAPLPALSLGVSAELDFSELFDINVARYSDHQRVKFYLDFFQGPARERMNVWLARLPVYEPMIRRALEANGLPQDLGYLALIESGFSNTAVSRSRATGMWQFMRGTAKDYRLRIDRWVDERRDPIKATLAATNYLRDLTKRFDGSYYLAAAAYNGGGGTVSRGLKKLGAGGDGAYFEEAELDADFAEDLNGDDRFFHLSDTKYLRRETKDYVPKLIAAAMIAKQPFRYGFAPIPAVEPYAVDSVMVPEPTSLEAVAKASGVEFETVKALNPHLLLAITPPGKSGWWVRVPVGFGLRTDSVLATYSSADRLPAGSHVVKRKETFTSVAKRYGLTVKELAGFNPGIDRSKGLKVGQRLRIPGGAALRLYAAEDNGASTTGVHTVRRGETVGGIAQRYRMSAARLRALNGISSRNLIRVGQRLRVTSADPAPRVLASAPSARKATSSSKSKQTVAAATTHMVRPGDTLSHLARRYGVTVPALMSANGMRSAKSLQAGARLQIPR